MKTIPDRIRSALILCLTLFGLSTLAQASSTESLAGEELLQDIHDARLNSYLLLTDYYNFSVNVGDKQLISSIEEGVRDLDGLLNKVAAGHDSPGYLATTSRLQESWMSYQDLLSQNINDIEEYGYPELQLVSQLAQVNVDMGVHLRNLYNLVTDEVGVRPSPVVSTTHQSAVTLAMMMTKYSARSTSNISQVFQGEDPEQTLDVLAMEFDRNLKSLLESDLANAETQALLKKAQIKWNFIRSSYLHYNENNVNFVVNLYSRQIIESLAMTTTEGEQAS